MANARNLVSVVVMLRDKNDDGESEMKKTKKGIAIEGENRISETQSKARTQTP